jgi:hypothetical protein
VRRPLATWLPLALEASHDVQAVYHFHVIAQRTRSDRSPPQGGCEPLLHRQTPLARQVLSCLLDGRIAWTPRKAEGLYEFSGRVKYDQLLGIVVTQGMVPVRGFDTLHNFGFTVGLAFSGTLRLAA